MVYLDTSVVAAYYCPEPLSAIVEEEFLKREDPAVSLLTALEMYSAVSRKIREHALSQADGNRIINRFQSHVSGQFYHSLPVESNHYQIAQSWIGRFNTPLRTLDALHLAIASVKNIPLITSDARLADSGRVFGIDIIFIS